uniref:SURP motif domain-containing protein n=1 Tax=Peronospora matthiolae TaxID=2874970 RepID=A0AAV1UJU1_9STRA
MTKRERYETNVAALGVRGYSCQVFNDPETAWELHTESHLIPWRGQKDSDLLVDRFDARNLLDERRQFRQLKKRKRKGSRDGCLDPRRGPNVGTQDDPVETELRELHRLRFGEYTEEFPPVEDVVVNQFPYQYPEDETSDPTSDEEAFEPLWVVPGHLVVPKTRKLHAIVEATATKVREHPQLEAMLKVKLGANAKFRFLSVSHELYGYYCFLRDENPQPVPAKKTSFGVSLLGEEYDDDSDEEKTEKHQEACADESS